MKKSKKVPMRMCVGCGEMREKNSLLRVVKTENGEIHLDETGKVNGRGAYVCNNQNCLNMAQKNHGLERSLKQAIDPMVYGQLNEEMKEIEAE